MILSYHPCFVGDQNRCCAGREPNEADREMIVRAEAVILPQAPPPRLYEMARSGCAHVFPNYDVRFQYPGKIGQIQLFKNYGAPCPRTYSYKTIQEYPDSVRDAVLPHGLSFPVVFKFDWGGEGDNIFFVNNRKELQQALRTAARFEQTGQRGFLLQSFIPSGRRTLRVVVMGQKMISYWKMQPDPARLCAGIAKGALIDSDRAPDLQKMGVKRVNEFCRRTGIHLAGFDLLFAEGNSSREPLFLEINYFFGRKGIGGAERFYQILIQEIYNWLDQNRLPRPESQPDGGY